MKLFIGNLSKQVQEDDLEVLFKEHGTVLSVSIIKDMFSHESKGFGFVEMKNRNDAQKAIEVLNLKELKGNKISVAEAHPKNNSRGGGSRNNRNRR